MQSKTKEDDPVSKVQILSLFCQTLRLPSPNTEKQDGSSPLTRKAGVSQHVHTGISTTLFYLLSLRLDLTKKIPPLFNTDEAYTFQKDRAQLKTSLLFRQPAQAEGDQKLYKSGQ